MGASEFISLLFDRYKAGLSVTTVGQDSVSFTRNLLIATMVFGTMSLRMRTNQIHRFLG